MTTLDDLLMEIGRLHMENLMLRQALIEAQKAPTEEQEENNGTND